MFRLLQVGLLIICATAVSAQPVDSLKQALAKTGQDTNRVKTLLKLSYALGHVDTAAALTYARQARTLAQTLEGPYWVAISYVRAGDAYLFSNNYGPALTNYQAALHISEQERDDELRALVLNELGLLYADLGQYATASRHLFQSLRLSERVREDIEKGRRKGLNYKIADNQVGNRYLNLAMVSGRAKEYARAVEYMNKALPVFRRNQDTRGVAIIYVDLGELAYETKQYNTARNQYQRALELAKQMGETDLVYIATYGIGKTWLEQNNLAAAEPSLSKALVGFRTINDQKGEAEVMIYLARAAIRRQDYPKANTYLTEAGAKAHAAGLIDTEAHAYEVMLAADTLQGEYRRALRHQARANALNDSLINAEARKNMNGLHIEYETEKKQQQIGHLQSESRLQKRLTYVAIGAVLATLALLGFVLYNQRLKQRLYAQRTKLLEEEHQLAMLEKQLEQEKTKRIREQLDHKSREVATAVMNLYQKNELLTTLKQKVEQLHDSIPLASTKEVRQLIDHNLALDNDWEKFKAHFEEVHPYFFSKLLQIAPQLSPNELKHCAYLRMNLSNKEVASLLNVNPDSVKMSRYRIKKKFDLMPEDDLNGFIATV